MKKKKSPKKHEENSHSKGERPKQVIFNHYIKEMEDIEKEFKIKNKDVNFYLLQSIKNKDKVRDMIFNLVYFYDYNFIGNKDFIRIPNISDVLNNVLKYPIMLSTKTDETGNEEIIGASTIKMENNYSLKQNPYFPTCNEDVLFITGVLTKLYKNGENRINGVGKNLFKSAIRAAYFINKKRKIRLVTEIDCRNQNSINAITKAVDELKDEGIGINLFITGYYVIKNKENMITEAPTFIFEIDLNGDKKIKDTLVEFNYERSRNEYLYSDLFNIIEANTHRIKNYINRLDDRTTCYYHKIKPINANKMNLIVGESANGNDRQPSINLQLETINY